MNADDVQAARTAMLVALTPSAAALIPSTPADTGLTPAVPPLAAEADWGVPAGPLEWSCSETAAHIAHDLIAYATQLTARAADAYLPLDLTVRPEATPAQILQIAATSADLLSLALRAATPVARAWHWGPTDPSGFAALGVNEILIHTSDICAGLAIDWSPPPQLCAAVLSRLFPDAPRGDPAAVLLWCTGRIALPDHPRRTSWTLRAARD